MRLGLFSLSLHISQVTYATETFSIEIADVLIKYHHIKHIQIFNSNTFKQFIQSTSDDSMEFQIQNTPLQVKIVGLQFHQFSRQKQTTKDDLLHEMKTVIEKIPVPAFIFKFIPAFNLDIESFRFVICNQYMRLSLVAQFKKFSSVVGVGTTAHKEDPFSYQLESILKNFQISFFENPKFDSSNQQKSFLTNQGDQILKIPIIKSQQVRLSLKKEIGGLFTDENVRTLYIDETSPNSQILVRFGDKTRLNLGPWYISELLKFVDFLNPFNFNNKTKELVLRTRRFSTSFNVACIFQNDTPLVIPYFNGLYKYDCLRDDPLVSWKQYQNTYTEVFKHVKEKQENDKKNRKNKFKAQVEIEIDKEEKAAIDIFFEKFTPFIKKQSDDLRKSKYKEYELYTDDDVLQHNEITAPSPENYLVSNHCLLVKISKMSQLLYRQQFKYYQPFKEPKSGLQLTFKMPKIEIKTSFAKQVFLAAEDFIFLLNNTTTYFKLPLSFFELGLYGRNLLFDLNKPSLDSILHLADHFTQEDPIYNFYELYNVKLQKLQIKRNYYAKKTKRYVSGRFVNSQISINLANQNIVESLQHVNQIVPSQQFTVGDQLFASWILQGDKAFRYLQLFTSQQLSFASNYFLSKNRDLLFQSIEFEKEQVPQLDIFSKLEYYNLDYFNSIYSYFQTNLQQQIESIDYNHISHHQASLPMTDYALVKEMDYPDQQRFLAYSSHFQMELKMKRFNFVDLDSDIVDLLIDQLTINNLSKEQCNLQSPYQYQTSFVVCSKNLSFYLQGAKDSLFSQMYLTKHNDLKIGQVQLFTMSINNQTAMVQHQTSLLEFTIDINQAVLIINIDVIIAIVRIIFNIILECQYCVNVVDQFRLDTENNLISYLQNIAKKYKKGIEKDRNQSFISIDYPMSIQQSVNEEESKAVDKILVFKLNATNVIGLLQTKNIQELPRRGPFALFNPDYNLILHAEEITYIVNKVDLQTVQEAHISPIRLFNSFQDCVNIKHFFIQDIVRKYNNTQVFDNDNEQKSLYQVYFNNKKVDSNVKLESHPIAQIPWLLLSITLNQSVFQGMDQSVLLQLKCLVSQIIVNIDLDQLSKLQDGIFYSLASYKGIFEKSYSSFDFKEILENIRKLYESSFIFDTIPTQQFSFRSGNQKQFLFDIGEVIVKINNARTSNQLNNNNVSLNLSTVEPISSFIVTNFDKQQKLTFELTTGIQVCLNQQVSQLEKQLLLIKSKILLKIDKNGDNYFNNFQQKLFAMKNPYFTQNYTEIQEVEPDFTINDIIDSQYAQYFCYYNPENYQGYSKQDGQNIQIQNPNVVIQRTHLYQLYQKYDLDILQVIDPKPQMLLAEQHLNIQFTIRDKIYVQMLPESVQQLILLQQYQLYQSNDNLEDILDIYSQGYSIDFLRQFMQLEQDLRNILVLVRQESQQQKRQNIDLNIQESDLVSLEIQDSSTIVSAEDLQQQLEQYDMFQCIKFQRIRYGKNYWTSVFPTISERQIQSVTSFEFKVPQINIQMVGIGQDIIFNSDQLLVSLITKQKIIQPQFQLLYGISKLKYLCNHSIIEKQQQCSLIYSQVCITQKNINLYFSKETGNIYTQNYDIQIVQTPQLDKNLQQLKFIANISQIQGLLNPTTLYTVVQFIRQFQFQDKSQKQLKQTKLQLEQQQKVLKLYLLNYQSNASYLVNQEFLAQFSNQELKQFLSSVYESEIQQQITQFCYKIKTKQSIQFIYNILNNAADSFKTIPNELLQQFLRADIPSFESLKILTILSQNINFKKIGVKKQIKYLSINLLTGSGQATINFNGFHCIFSQSNPDDLETLLLPNENYISVQQLQLKGQLYLTEQLNINLETILLIKNTDLRFNNQIIYYILQDYTVIDQDQQNDLSQFSQNMDEQFIDIVQDQPKGIFQNNENFRSLIQNLVLEQQLPFGRKLMKWINGINIQFLLHILGSQIQFSIQTLLFSFELPKAILSISTNEAKLYPKVINQFQIQQFNFIIRDCETIISDLEVKNFNILQRSSVESLVLQGQIKEDLITLVQISVDQLTITITDADIGLSKLLYSFSLLVKDVNQSFDQFMPKQKQQIVQQDNIQQISELSSVILLLNFKQVLIKAKLSNFINIQFVADNIVTQVQSLGCIKGQQLQPAQGFTAIYQMILSINESEELFLPKIILYYAYYQQANHLNCSAIISSQKLNINIETIALLCFIQQNFIKYKLYIEKFTKGSKKPFIKQSNKHTVKSSKSLGYSVIVQTSPIILNVGMDSFVFNFISNEIQCKFTNCNSITGNAFGTNFQVKQVNTTFGPKYQLIVSQIYFIQSKHWVDKYFGIKNVYNDLKENCLLVETENQNIISDIYLLISTKFYCEGFLSKLHQQNTIDVNQLSCHIHPNLIFAVKQIYIHFKFLLQTLQNDENQQQKLIKLKHIQKQFIQDEIIKQNTSIGIKLNISNIFIILQTFKDVQLELNVPQLFYEQLTKQKFSEQFQQNLKDTNIQLNIDSVTSNLTQKLTSTDTLCFSFKYNFTSKQDSVESSNNAYKVIVDKIVLSAYESFGAHVYSVMFSLQFAFNQQVEIAQQLFIKYKDINLDSSIIDNLIDQSDIFVDFAEQFFIKNSLIVNFIKPQISLSVSQVKDFQTITLVLPSIQLHFNQYTQPFGRLQDYQTENCYKIYKTIIDEYNIGCLTFYQPYQQENCAKLFIGNFNQELPQEIFVYAQYLLKLIDFVQIYENRVQLLLTENKFIPKFNSDRFNQNIKLAQKEILNYFSNNVIIQLVAQLSFFKLTIHSSSNKQNYDENYSSLVIFFSQSQFAYISQNKNLQLFVQVRQFVLYTIQNNMLLPITLYQTYVNELPVTILPLGILFNGVIFSYSQVIEERQNIISVLLNIDNIEFQSAPLAFQSISIFYNIWSQNIIAMQNYIRQQVSSLQSVKKQVETNLKTKIQLEKVLSLQLKLDNIKLILNKSEYYNTKDIHMLKLNEKEVTDDQLRLLLQAFIKIKDKQQNIQPIMEFTSIKDQCCLVLEITKQNDFIDSITLLIPGFQNKLSDEMSNLIFRFDKTLIQMQNLVLSTKFQVSFTQLQLIHKDNSKLIMDLNLGKSYLNLIIQQQENSLVLQIGDFIGSFAITTVQSISKILSSIIFESKSYWNVGQQTIEQSSLFILPDYIHGLSNQSNTLEDIANQLKSSSVFKSPKRQQSKLFLSENINNTILKSKIIKQFQVKNNLSLQLCFNKIVISLSQYSLQDKLLIFLKFSDTTVHIKSVVYPQDSYDCQIIDFSLPQIQRYNFINNRIDLQFSLKTKQILLQLIDVFDRLNSLENIEQLQQQKKIKVSTVVQLNDSYWSVHSTNALKLNNLQKTVSYATFAQIFSNPGKFIVGDNILRISEMISQMIKDIKCFILTIQKQVLDKEVIVKEDVDTFFNNCLILEQNGEYYFLKDTKFKNLDSLFPTLDILGKCTGIVELITKNISGIQKLIETKIDNVNTFCVEISQAVDKFADMLLK
ncbi:hypothetical protein SS50377_28052 [Spironucleus salmonicida]|uniref:Transmembrane protein n=1 Tax=Spironucleus salmonicida TaxID=348837 RepID=V6LFX4_9EUKA|nr:hypothetical protein SS50377_28052 [Spironucleus salmonicida]|eukprot:EST42606.1 hypothetical protein SS50377_17925 [Spironucleus salmonicida]